MNHFDVRLDHSFRPSDDLFARYSFADDNLFDPFAGSSGDASVPGYGLRIPSRSQNAALGETHIFTPALVNELRLTFNRVSNGDFPQGQGASINRQLGLPELSTNPRDWGLTLISVNGFSPIGDEPTSPEHGTTNTYQIADNATWTRGRHLVKFGFDLRLLQQNAYRDIESRGFFNFTGLLLGNPLEELLLGAPTETGGATENNPQHLRSRSYDFFANDTWRARPDLALTLGLRYEYNSPAVDAANRADVYNPATGSLVQLGQSGFPRGGYDPDYRNLAPRIGLAWSPGGRNTTVFRAAYGIHYDQSPLAPGEGLYFSAPYYNFNLYYPIQGLVNLSLTNPFPSNFPFPYPGSAIAFQRDLRTPYIQQWNFGVQRQLGKSRVLEIAYVGSKGTHLIDSRNINQPQPSVNQQNPGPNPHFSEIDIIESQANSIYHSLQARLQQRLWRGLSLLASYTYAKSIDDASGFFNTTGDPNFPQNSYDLSAERGRSDFDIRQRFTLSYAYDLPVFKGHRWIGGWQSFGVLTFQTGQPFTVALLPDNDNTNTGISQLGFGANDRPNVVGNPRLANPTPREWFNTAAFATPPYGHFGNAGRDILDGPGLETVNFSMVKNTAVTERLNLQFRTEFFNLLNRTNFNLPDNFVGSPTFGQVVSAQDPRRIQFAIAYGNPNTLHVDPIEKKPLFHFLPGTRAYSIATAGCTMACLNCQNWEISQVSPADTTNYDLFPAKVIEEAVKNNTKSIAYTYAEPIAFYDYTLDTCKIARAKGLKNLLISNGYINEKPLRELAKYTDAANINLKSYDDDIYVRLNGGRLQPILETLKILKEENVWLEITNLIVPTWTDNLDMVKKMCDWLYTNQLQNYPLHFIRFFPLYKLTQLPETPVSALEKAREIAMKAGIKYVYIGNVPGHAAENTFCHKCKKMIIERKGFTIITENIVKGKCKFCGEPIPGIWS